jgi:Cu(I)/Ag(I) efflux system membrane fusion protein
VLKIPAEAMIVTGERATVVKVVEEGRFQPVDVVAGMERAGEVEILSGLEEGDRIVLSGQFLIDSESSLQASFMRFPAGDPAGTETSETPGAAHAHH